MQFENCFQSDEKEFAVGQFWDINEIIGRKVNNFKWGEILPFGIVFKWSVFFRYFCSVYLFPTLFPEGPSLWTLLFCDNESLVKAFLCTVWKVYRYVIRSSKFWYQFVYADRNILDQGLKSWRWGLVKFWEEKRFQMA